MIRDVIKKIEVFFNEKKETKDEPKKIYVEKAKNDNYYVFDNKDEERFFLLKKTSEGFNSAFLINYLKYAVLMSSIEKKGSLNIKNENSYSEITREINGIICNFAQNTKFWSIGIPLIMKDIEQYEFTGQPSLNRISNKESTIYLNIDTEKKLDCFEEINLSQHLLNTMKTYIEDFKDQMDDFCYPRFEVLLSCLLHDFGKSKILQKSFDMLGVENLRHEEVSGLYIDRLLKEIDDRYIFDIGKRDDEYELGVTQFKRIKKAVEEHHKDYVEKGSLSDLLRMIDYKTRSKEFEEYNKGKNKNKIKRKKNANR